MALTVTDIIFPDPVKPGVGTPPLKLIVPAELEKEGSSTHKEKIEPPLLTDTTSIKSVGNLIVASALFIATPEVSTDVRIVAVFPDVIVEALEYKCKTAA